MEYFKSKYIEAPEILTPDDGAYYFYGYYDMCPAREDGSFHLAHRVRFMDRLQTASDTAELGYLSDGTFVPFAVTSAWNFQQGAMLRYRDPKHPVVFYNIRCEGGFSTVTHDLETGVRKFTDRACAAVSPDGAYGAAVNFLRIFDFRPGYGYAGEKDPFFSDPAPDADGAFLTDLSSGESKLLLSYRTLRTISGLPADSKILINHVTFSPDSGRFVMLVRSFPTPGKADWRTSMIVSDLFGRTKTIMADTYVSHYWWIDEKTILAHCAPESFTDHGLFSVNIETGQTKRYEAEYLSQPKVNCDIHCSLSPDGRYIIGDGYPIGGMRSLVAIDLKTGRSGILFSAASRTVPPWDIRCDLHARFTAGGKYISFDTTHNGVRQIASVPAQLLQAI